MSFISDNYLFNNDSYKSYKTGDLLLCSSGSHTSWPISWLSNLIKLGTKSAFTHVAIVLKNPHFIHPSLHGFYVWESSYNGTKDPQDNKIKLIYFSTNYVYPGTKGNYKEIDPVNPINKYALSKLGGESAVRMYDNSLILRIIMCEKPFTHKSAFFDIFAEIESPGDELSL